jgi:hypothetical protein
MNRNQIKDLLPAIKGLAEGKEIEYCSSASGCIWSNVENPGFVPGFRYRVKPEKAIWYIGVFRVAKGYYDSRIYTSRNSPIDKFYKDMSDLEWSDNFVRWVYKGPELYLNCNV